MFLWLYYFLNGFFLGFHCCVYYWYQVSNKHFIDSFNLKCVIGIYRFGVHRIFTKLVFSITYIGCQLFDLDTCVLECWIKKKQPMFLINSSLSDLISPILSEARNCGMWWWAWWDIARLRRLWHMAINVTISSSIH